MTEADYIMNIFPPGSRITLEYAINQGSIKKATSRIEDLEGTYLVIQAPVVDNAPASFRESQELTLRRIDDLKKEAYVTNVFVIEIRQGKTPLLVCSKPQKIDKTSLRRFSRFAVDIPFKYRFGEARGSGRLHDFSLTGCYALINPEPLLEEGSVLNLSISLPGEPDVIVKGKIIRTDKLPEKGKIGLAIDYQDLSENVKDTIYNYIFQLQLTSDRFSGGRDL